MSLESLVVEFAHLLKRKMEICRSMLLLLQEEERCMRDLSLEGINRCLKERENLVLQLKILKETSQTLTKRISERLGAEAAPLTLEALLQLVDEPTRDSLTKHHRELTDLARETIRLNDRRKRVLNRAISNFHESLAFLAEKASAEMGYCERGTIENPSRGKSTMHHTV